MSNSLSQPTRLSTEGLLLIKSFAGFRPEAVRRRDGVLIIGYGHSQTARSGVSITEEEAELLLLYDLIPVIKALHTHVKVPLNQYQFDALASFILSISIERFTRSDVLEHLNHFQIAQAGLAMAEWSDRVPPPVDAPYRRRAAERALFEQNPEQAANLAQILTAPIPARGKADPNSTGNRLPVSLATMRHEQSPPREVEMADYGALAFTGAIGALALVAGYLAFWRDLAPSPAGGGSIWVGAVLIIAGAVFITAAGWNLIQNRNNRLFT